MQTSRRLLLTRAAALGALPFVASACTFASAFPPPRITLSKAAPIELPCRIGPGGLVLLRGRVDGRAETWFALDTGAPVTVLIDGQRSAALGLDSRGARKLGPEDDPAVPVGVIRPGMEIGFDGQLSLSGLSVVVIPHATLACPDRFDAAGFDGVIGADLMRRFVVEIDGAARRVRLHEPTAFVLPAGWESLPLEVDGGGHLYVGAQLLADAGASSAPVRLHVDSGSTRALTLRLGSHPAIAAPAGGQRQETCFVNGRRPVLRADQAQQLRLGTLGVTVARPDYVALADAAMRRSPHHGTIGMPLLARHGPIVDVPGRRLCLRREAIDMA
jgi:hypothetical protein